MSRGSDKCRCEDECKKCSKKCVKGDIVIANKVLKVPSKCLKYDDYTNNNYKRFGAEGRFIGAWEYTITAPPVAGGVRSGVLTFQLGGTCNATSTVLNSNPQIAQRNMFQGEWYVNAESDSAISIGAIYQVLFYNSLGQVVSFQVLKCEFILTKKLNPLLDTIASNILIQNYNLIFATPGDPTTSVVGKVKVGPLIPAPLFVVRLANTSQFLDLKTYFNNCESDCL